MTGNHEQPNAPDIYGARKETANMYPDDQSNDLQYLQETHGQPTDAAAPVVPFECLLAPTDRAWPASVSFNLEFILLMCAMNKLEAENARLRELLHAVLTTEGECHVV